MADKETKLVLTIRNMPKNVDAVFASKARAHGRTKIKFVQEMPTSTFGDPIGNFIRSSELVALMDRELARVTGQTLSGAWTDGGMTLPQSREFCRLLGIRGADDLQRIMMAAVPWLHLRARQLGLDIPLLPRGVSLSCALFIEAAGLEYRALLPVRRSLYFLTDEQRFWRNVDEVREARMLPPLDRPA